MPIAIPNKSLDALKNSSDESERRFADSIHRAILIYAKQIMWDKSCQYVGLEQTMDDLVAMWDDGLLQFVMVEKDGLVIPHWYNDMDDKYEVAKDARPYWEQDQIEDQDEKDKDDGDYFFGYSPN